MIGIPTSLSRRRIGRLLVVLVVLLAAAGLPGWPSSTASAADAPAAPAAPWEEGPAFAADPAAVAAAAGELAPPEGEAVEVLLAETEFEVDELGVVRSRYRRVYRLLSRAGVDGWSAIDHAWSPWYQERPEVRARVIRADGSARELDQSTVAEAPIPGHEPEMFEDTRQLRAPLPGTEVGAVVETEISVTRQRPLFEAGQAMRWLLAEYGPVRLARATVTLPRDLEKSVRWTDLEPPARTEEGGRVRLAFAARDLASLADREFGTPPGEGLGPSIAFATGRSWREVAAAYAAIVDAKVEGADVGDLLADLGDPGDDSDRWLARLLTRLHRRVRYTGIEFDEARIVPRTPAETLARGFGDCKDKSALLVAALRRAGLEADVALLRTNWAFDSDPDLPGLGMFDHAIVRVGGATPVWIDATDPYSRPGELPSQDQDRLALVANERTGDLERTPAATAADNRRVEVRELFLGELGTGRAVETGEYHGSPARALRYNWEGSTHEELVEGLEPYAQETYHSEEPVVVESTEPDDLTEPMRTRLEVSGAGVATTDLGEAVAVAYLGGLFEDLPWALTDPEAEPREGDLAVEPHSAEITYRIHVPPGLAPRQVPGSAEDAIGPARLVRRWETSEDGREVVAHLSFSLDRRRLSAAEVEAMREALETLEEEGAGSALVWFDQTVHAHLQAGRIAEALGEAQRLIALHPEEALHRIQLTSALLAAGLGVEARDQARRATEIEPESAAAWAALGRALLHDEVGRYLHAGFDREGGIDALARAAELDSEDVGIVADRAIALEHDDRGRRYAEGADLDAAIAAYREIDQAELTATELAPNLAVALLKAGRFEELREAARMLDDAANKALFGVLATAVLDGAEAAIAEAERLQPAGEARLGLLNTVGFELIQQRRYAEAATMVAAASRLSPQPAAMLGQAEVLRRTVRHEDVARDPAAPLTLVLTMAEVFADPAGEGDAVDLRRLFASSQPEMFETVERSALAAGFDAGLAAAGAGDLSRDVLLDLAAGAMTLTKEGDDATGYRIRMEVPGADSRRFFAVPEDGALRLVSIATHAQTIGYEVLARLERGDHEGARKWLDWAHEEVFVPKNRTDPLLGSPLWHFWSRGDSADAERMRLAALALAASAEPPDRIVEALEAAREAAAKDDRWRIDIALLAAHRSRRDAEAILAVAERLAGSAGDSEILFDVYANALLQERRLDDAERLGEARLAEYPDDPAALHHLAEVAIWRREYDRAAELYDRLEATGEANANHLNSAAWLSLVRGVPQPRDLDRAQKAAAKLSFRSYPSLNTLAAVYAAAGRAAEAYQLLLQSLDAAGSEQLEAADWYVVGLMAEGLGLTEAAIRCYERAEALPGSAAAETVRESYPLASDRLAAARREALLRAAAGAAGEAGSGLAP